MAWSGRDSGQKRTRVLEQTPGTANLMAALDDAVAQVRVALLQAVGKVNAGETRADNDDVVVDVARASVLHDGGYGWYLDFYKVALEAFQKDETFLKVRARQSSGRCVCLGV